MTISVDGTSSAATTSGTQQTWSHVCSGDNRKLVVATGIPDNDSISGVTYNGVSMTQASKIEVVGDRWIYLYYLDNPSTGTNNVVVTSSVSQPLRSCAASYTGCNPGIDVAGSNTGNSATSAGTITTTVDNSWIVMNQKTVNGYETTVGANTYKRVDVADVNSEMFDTNGSQTPVGEKTMSVTHTSDQWGVVMVAIPPYLESTANNMLNLTSKYW